VRHFASPRFWTAYDGLTAKVRALADKNFELLKANPSHPGVQLKKVGRYWSARVGINHRALAIDHEGDLLWFWIGTHADYDQLLK
jgi:hypothetical protein